MSEVTIAAAHADDVRGFQLRRRQDDTTLKLALDFAERGCAWVARDDGESIGVSFAHVSDDERYAGGVFVEPSYRGQGVGGQLLDAALGSPGDAARAALLDASDRTALALALRRRLSLRETVVRVAGAIPRPDRLLQMAAGDYRFDVDAIDPVRDAFAIDALDRDARGVARIAEHTRFAAGATGQAFFLNGELVGYAYAWPDGRIGPMAGASAAYLVQLFSYALVTLQRSYGASWCTLLLPGSNVRVAAAAMRTGLRIQETFALACDVPLPDLSRYAGFHPLLF